jgi:8-oxo-dGTP diphosphatase
MVFDPEAKTPSHAVAAVVFQIRGGRLQVLLWQRAQEPFHGDWALPGGLLDSAETLEESIRRHLTTKVDVRELSHLEQLETRSAPDRNPACRELLTAYLGLIPTDANPSLPADTRWHPVDELPTLAYDHRPVIAAALERLRGKLSYSNLGFALAPETFTLSQLRDLYSAALGYPVEATNLHRVLRRRQVLEEAGSRREPGPHGGRPAQLFRFTSRGLTITDQFATLRPPGRRV